MDFGAFVIEKMEPSIHASVVRRVGSYLNDRGLGTETALLQYGVHPGVPGGIAVSVITGEPPDLYLWHSEHAALAGGLAHALRCEVWCLTRERRTGFTEGVRFGPTGTLKYRVGEESDRALTTCARRVGATKDALLDLLEGGGSFFEHPLAQEAGESPFAVAVEEVLAAKPRPKASKPKPSAPRASSAVIRVGEGSGEEQFIVPARWASILDRRRGGWLTEDELRPDPDAAWRVARDTWQRIASVGRWLIFEGTPSDGSGPRMPELIEAVAARFEAERVEQRGVDEEAGTASMLRSLGEGFESGETAIVDWWVGAFGLSFAVDCALETMRHAVAFQRCGQTGADYTMPVFGPPIATLRAVRRHLAAASDERYAAARERCAAARASLDIPGLYAAAYLFPSEPSWREELSQLASRVGTRAWASWPHASATKVPPRLAGNTSALLLLPALVEGLGSEIVPSLQAFLSYARDTRMPARPELTLVGEALSSIPSDEAMQALLETKGWSAMSKHLRRAQQQYPERAKRLG